ncbi:PfkB family carbohydrate kinase [Allobaculum sp. Allo2]|uniref:PfkB family carbohydrate kinase n=1 Tax=Allobaculum sp. Allo2 TaxID=2853432 RepID=UPI00211333D6|nr:PfkB family carbohydrate kinase [Allobaculum sp. Allo2]
MIYTLTANPSLDYIMRVDHFETGETNRAEECALYPGGKGINVSTILGRLGHENTALGFVAGFSGQELVRMLEERRFKRTSSTVPAIPGLTSSSNPAGKRKSTDAVCSFVRRTWKN